MKETFDLQKHIEQGVEKIVSDTIKATLKNPKESAFMVRFAAASRRASKTRMKLEQERASRAAATCTARAATPAATTPRSTRLP